MDLLCSRGINVFNIEFIGLDPTFNELKIIYQISNEVYVAKWTKLEDKSKILIKKLKNEICEIELILEEHL